MITDEREAWLLLARLFREAESDAQGCFHTYQRCYGLCVTIKALCRSRAICQSLRMVMLDKIDKSYYALHHGEPVRSKAVSVGYIWELDENGRRWREEYCLKQAANLENGAC